MLSTIGKLLFKSYSVLMGVALGGLVGANLAGFCAGLILDLASDVSHASSIEPHAWWRHAGWIVGAGIGLIATMLQMRRLAKRHPNKPTDPLVAPAKPATKKTGRPATRNAHSKPSGILSAVGFFAFFGGIMGSMVGGSLLLLWFSLTYSPWAPADWQSSVSTGTRRNSAGIQKSVITSDNAVAIYAFCIPFGLGVVGGGLLGGVGAAMGWVTDD